MGEVASRAVATALARGEGEGRGEEAPTYRLESDARKAISAYTVVRPVYALRPAVDERLWGEPGGAADENVFLCTRQPTALMHACDPRSPGIPWTFPVAALRSLGAAYEAPGNGGGGDAFLALPDLGGDAAGAPAYYVDNATLQAVGLIARSTSELTLKDEFGVERRARLYAAVRDVVEHMAPRVITDPQWRNWARRVTQTVGITYSMDEARASGRGLRRSFVVEDYAVAATLHREQVLIREFGWDAVSPTTRRVDLWRPHHVTDAVTNMRVVTGDEEYGVAPVFAEITLGNPTTWTRHTTLMNGGTLLGDAPATLGVTDNPHATNVRSGQGRGWEPATLTHNATGHRTLLMTSAYADVVTDEENGAHVQRVHVAGALPTPLTALPTSPAAFRTIWGAWGKQLLNLTHMLVTTTKPTRMQTTKPLRGIVLVHVVAAALRRACADPRAMSVREAHWRWQCVARLVSVAWDVVPRLKKVRWNILRFLQALNNKEPSRAKVPDPEFDAETAGFLVAAGALLCCIPWRTAGPRVLFAALARDQGARALLLRHGVAAAAANVRWSAAGDRAAWRGLWKRSLARLARLRAFHKAMADNAVAAHAMLNADGRSLDAGVVHRIMVSARARHPATAVEPSNARLAAFSASMLDVAAVAAEFRAMKWTADAVSVQLPWQLTGSVPWGVPLDAVPLAPPSLVAISRDPQREDAVVSAADMKWGVEAVGELAHRAAHFAWSNWEAPLAPAWTDQRFAASVADCMAAHVVSQNAAPTTLVAATHGQVGHVLRLLLAQLGLAAPVQAEEGGEGEGEHKGVEGGCVVAPQPQPRWSPPLRAHPRDAEDYVRGQILNHVRAEMEAVVDTMLVFRSRETEAWHAWRERRVQRVAERAFCTLPADRAVSDSAECLACVESFDGVSLCQVVRLDCGHGGMCGTCTLRSGAKCPMCRKETTVCAPIMGGGNTVRDVQLAEAWLMEDRAQDDEEGGGRTVAHNIVRDALMRAILQGGGYRMAAGETLERAEAWRGSSDGDDS